MGAPAVRLQGVANQHAWRGRHFQGHRARLRGRRPQTWCL